MFTQLTRCALFTLVCVPVRIGIAVAAAYTPPKYLPILGGFAAISAAGNMYRYVKHNDKQTGAFGQSVWWNNHRIAHMIIMIIFVILACAKNKYTWVAPAADITYGVVNMAIRCATTT